MAGTLYAMKTYSLTLWPINPDRSTATPVPGRFAIDDPLRGRHATACVRVIAAGRLIEQIADVGGLDERENRTPWW